MNEGKQSSPLSFKQLPVGFEFPPTSYQLTEPVIAKYLEAVGETSDFLTSGIVPPLAIAACAMTALSQSFTVPPGSIHASQELVFLRVVPVGTSISCGGKIAQKLERGSLNLVILEINVTNQSGEKVMTGKATIAAPN
jgi:acyl dehydratase